MKTYRFYHRIVFRHWRGVFDLLGLFSLAACSVASPSLDTLPFGEGVSELSVSLVETGASPSPSPTATLTFTVTPSATFTLTPTPLPPNAGWPVGQTLLVGRRDGAWLRQTPDSHSERIISVLANGTAVAVTGQPFYDGAQWWWPVNAATGYSGWVEQAALNKTASKNWNLGQRLTINKAQDVWLRGSPSSASDEIVAVLPDKTVVTVSGEPADDGVQWWWPVTGLAGQSGWVEQDSLTDYVPPTATPRTRMPIAPPVGNPIVTVEQPPVIPATQPPGAPPIQPPVDQPRPTPLPVTAPPAATSQPTVEQPPEIPATPPPPSGTVEFPSTVVAADPIVIAVAPSATPTARIDLVSAGRIRWRLSAKDKR